MLLEYPSFCAEIQQLCGAFLRLKTRQHLGPFGQAPEMRIFEGDRHIILREDGTRDESGMRRISESFEIEHAEVPTLTLATIFERLDRVAKGMAKQQAEIMLSHLSEVSSAAGNIFDGRGQKLSAAMILEAIRGMAVDFDDRGGPRMPSMLIPPVLEDAAREAIETFAADAGLQRQFTELVDMKREEWRAQEANRRLVG